MERQRDDVFPLYTFGFYVLKCGFIDIIMKTKIFSNALVWKTMNPQADVVWLFVDKLLRK